MKNILLLLMSFFVGTVFGYSQNEYTVVAPSGLSLREGPGLGHAKRLAAPFLAAVHLQEFNPDVYAASHIDTIDGKEGYWLPVSYEKEDGYMFSAYLKEGPLYRRASEEGLNHDFRITVPGVQCQPINFDPDLYWYGFYRVEGVDQLQVEAVNPAITFGYSYTEEDMEYAYVDEQNFTNIELKGDKTYLFLVGSRQVISPAQWAASESYIQQNPVVDEYFLLGRFIHPYERFFLTQKEQPYFLVGNLHTEIMEYSNRPSIGVNDYQLFLSNAPYGGVVNSEGDSVSLTKMMLEYPFLIHDYQYIHGPRLLSKIDLNGDDFPDLIFHHPDAGESCGGSASYYILLSQKGESGYSYRKVAEESIWGCFGC